MNKINEIDTKSSGGEKTADNNRPIKTLVITSTTYVKKINESSLTSAILRLLQAAGIYAWKVWQGPMSRRGISDILGCYRGRLFAIEVKHPHANRPPSIYQVRFLDAIREAGGIAILARSIEDVIDGLGLHDRFRPDPDSPIKYHRA